MLTNLTIKQFTIVESLTLDFDEGMSAFTGETGAGKSIIIDALNLALGQRADTSVIRQGADKCDICAVFAIDSNPDAIAWLAEQEVEWDSDIIVRRVINTNGRSKNFINGSVYPLAKVKEFGELLLNIHGQNQQYHLLKHENHLIQLDAFAINDKLVAQVSEQYQCLRAKEKELKSLTQSEDFRHKVELLNYQVDELNALSLQANELDDINSEHKKLSQASEFIDKTQTILNLLNESETDTTTISSLNQVKSLTEDMLDTHTDLKSIDELLNQALINCEEAYSELSHFHQQLEQNPERLNELESRLALIFDLARKHQIKPEALYQHHQQLIETLNQYNNNEERIKELEVEIEKEKESYLKLAEKLHKNRVKEAKNLSQQITEMINKLGMPNGQVDIDIQKLEKLSSKGIDRVEYMVTLNKGSSQQPLAKIASGGELSRISLAIQVLTAEKKAYPTLIFDEVDTGIGGQTAAKVGQLLRRLGNHTQVFCVTHQAQVASNANHHFLVEKKDKNKKTISEVKALSDKEKVNELARMLSGVTMTKQTLAHAKELLAQACA